MRKEIYIYGAGNRGKELVEIIQSFYEDKIKIGGFIDSYVEGQKCNLPIYKIAEISHDSIIVISIAQSDIALQIALALKKGGYDKIYWFNTYYNRRNKQDFFVEQCIMCSDWEEDSMMHVEMHAMDACNLNCVGCTHFSPIFRKEKPDIEKQLLDVELFHRKIKSVAKFFVLGGEPFLNDDVAMYTSKVKELFPNASVTIVTNGLLIPKLPENLLRYLGQENIGVSISVYEPTYCILNQIEDTLKKYNIMYHTRNSRNVFNIPLSQKVVDTPYCISEGCVTIGKGKIACCPTLMYIEDLNEKYGLDFPTEGRIDLQSNVTGLELKRLLKQSVPLCHHCTKNEIKWKTCGKEVLLEHFVTLDK